MKCSWENLTSELTTLMAERAESQRRIRDLEEENQVLRRGEREGNMEIDRQESRAGFNTAIFIYFTRQNLFFSQAEGETEEDLRSNEA